MSIFKVSILRGRKAVRADRRLRADEKRIRTQSAILYKTPTAHLVLTITVFSVRMRFSSVQKTRIWTPPRLQAPRSLAVRYDCARISGL